MEIGEPSLIHRDHPPLNKNEQFLPFTKEFLLKNMISVKIDLILGLIITSYSRSCITF